MSEVNESLSFEQSQNLNSTLGDIPNPFSNASVRQSLLKRVYLIFLLQQLVSFAFVILFIKIESIKSFASQKSWIIIVPLAISILCLILVNFVQFLRSRLSCQILTLILFTFSKSITLAIYVASQRLDLQETSIILVLIAFFVLFLLNHQTKKQSTISLEAGIVIPFCLLAFVLSLFLYQGPVGSLVSCAVAVIVYLFYIICDAHMVVELQERNFRLKTNDHVYVSLLLYYDVLRLIGFAFAMIFFGLATLLRSVLQCFGLK